jgi:hypothetical protein
MIKLKNSKLLSYIFFTLVNAAIALWFLEINIFLIRQTILTILYGILVFFNKDIEIIKDDLTLVNELLLKRSSFFKYETFLTFCMPLCILSFGTVGLSIFSENPLLLYLNYVAVFISIIYFILMSYRLYLIITVPEIRTVMLRSNKLSLNGSKRSFSTHTFVKACLECTRYAGVGVGIFFSTVYIGPKLAYGPQYRSPVVNFIGYQFTGLKSDDEVIYGLGQKFLSRYPEEKILVTENDGYTLSEDKLIQRAVEKKLNSVYLYLLGYKK